MRAHAVFAAAGPAAGLYESFYLRAVSPQEQLGVWIRHTVRKPPGQAPSGSVWCTVFDGRPGGRVWTGKQTAPDPLAPPEAWLRVAGVAEIGPGAAHGSCGAARWSLRITPLAPELRHLQPGLLYRTPLPRTKLTSPAPAARFDGTLELPGGEAVELTGWPGMVGHNWGSEHAERWIWLHGCAFAGAPEAWLDVALGRLAVGGRLTPWVANGALFLDGERHRVGGLLAPRPRVQASPEGAHVDLGGPGGLRLGLRARVAPGMAAGWRYADPGGGEHHVVNCSVAGIELQVRRAGATETLLESEHGGAYELGMRPAPAGDGEHVGEVPLAPFPDA